MKYFGTDGIRGKVGHDTMTAEFALRIANASAQALAPNGGTVLIGKDTRISGYMFESALEAGKLMQNLKNIARKYNLSMLIG